MTDTLDKIEQALRNILPNYLAWKEQGNGMTRIDVRLDDLRSARAALALIPEVRGEIERLTKERDEARKKAGQNHDLYNCAIVDLVDARAEIERLREAMTPSGETKAAYISEFKFTIDDIDGDGFECKRSVTVPWTTTKEIMKAIAERAKPAQKGE